MIHHWSMFDEEIHIYCTNLVNGQVIVVLTPNEQFVSYVMVGTSYSTK